jgi:hypothetical protein
MQTRTDVGIPPPIFSLNNATTNDVTNQDEGDNDQNDDQPEDFNHIDNSKNHWSNNEDELDENKFYCDISSNRPAIKKAEETEIQIEKNEIIEIKKRHLRTIKIRNKAGNKDKDKNNNTQKVKNIRSDFLSQKKDENYFINIKRERILIKEDKNNNISMSPHKKVKPLDKNLNPFHRNDLPLYELDNERKILPKSNDDYDMKKGPAKEELENELVTLILIVILMLKLKEKALICSKIK